MLVKRESWHYKWLAYSGVMSIYLNQKQFIDIRLQQGRKWVEIYEQAADYGFLQKPTNFCQYWRNVILYPFVILFANLSIAIGLLVASILFPDVMLVGAGAVFLGLLALAIFAFFALGISEVSGRVNKIKDDPNGFVGNLYGMYKTKICKIMEYETK